MKKITLCFLLVLTTQVMANPLSQVLKVKDRLRMSLWYEGLSEKQEKVIKKRQLPQELEIPLRKF